MTKFNKSEMLNSLGIDAKNNGTSTGVQFFANGDYIESFSPVDGELIGMVKTSTKEDYEKVMSVATSAFQEWKMKPAPFRGEMVRQFGEKLRKYKAPLGQLVSLEMGKSLQEGYGEVQEMIDMRMI